MNAQGHEAIPHTADVGLRVWAPDLGRLFEEAALGLTHLALGAGRAPREPDLLVPVDLAADDLVGLAYEWLNELIALGEIHRACVADVERLHVEGPAPARLSGRIGLRSFDGLGARPARHLKAATYHGLTVSQGPSGWTLVAYLDV